MPTLRTDQVERLQQVLAEIDSQLMVDWEYQPPDLPHACLAVYGAEPHRTMFCIGRAMCSVSGDVEAAFANFAGVVVDTMGDGSVVAYFPQIDVV